MSLLRSMFAKKTGLFGIVERVSVQVISTMKKFDYQKNVEILENERWWGGGVGQGIRMPITRASDYKSDFCNGCQGNTFNGIFVSNLGRYLITEGAYGISVSGGVISFSATEEITLGQAEEKTLKGAYLAASALVCENDNVGVPRDLLLYPQFCTWTEMLIDVTQDKTLAYAQSIVDCNLPHKLLIIDDKWSKEYGDWTFDEKKFYDPKAMMDKLHELGFKVYLWLVPFVQDTVPDFALLCENNALVRGADGKPTLKTWWNGQSFVLDLTNPFAWNWLKTKLDYFCNEYGVDGFKFDAGDTDYYDYDDVTYAPTTPPGQSLLWSQFAAQYEYSELRACFRLGGSHVITRLSDKQRNWSDECGIGTLVPNMIQAGICCYPYSCADMIGGGVSADFDKPGSGEAFDFELISRFCECSALMPCMQFSYAYWNRSEKIKALFLKYADLHMQVKDYLSSLIDEAAKTHAPILRHLEYEFPHQGYADTMSAFMLGSKYLVAPVVKQGQQTQTLRLPQGANWKYCPDGVVYQGGEEVTVAAPVGVLPYFERV